MKIIFTSLVFLLMGTSLQASMQSTEIKKFQFKHCIDGEGEDKIVLYDQDQPHEAIGWSIYTINENSAHIEMIEIHEHYQGQGLGTKLLLKTLSEIRKVGAKKATLFALGSIPFYLRVGFKLCEKPRRKSAVMKLKFKNTNPKICLERHYQKKKAMNNVVTSQPKTN